jgi:glutamate carboxypeptidase
MADPTTSPAPDHAAGPALVSEAELERLRGAVEVGLPGYLRDLERLVNIDCGTWTKAGVDEVGAWVAEALAGLGARVERHANAELGDTVVGELTGAAGGPTILLIGHMDTVFDPGTVAERPYSVADGRARGPGVADMKSGLLAGLYALRALRAVGGEREGDGGAGWLPVGRLVFVANPDEEIGSPASGPLIRSHAADADVALVLECARASGDIVSARKGIVDLELRLRGRAAHAGVEPEKGRSAVLDAAHRVVALHALNGRWPSVTVNAGVLRGGTRPNVVAEEAVIQVDVRAAVRAELEAAEAAVRAIAARSTVPDVTCEVADMGRHWPMERTPATAHLVARAQGVAKSLGFPLGDTATGGASDANTTSGMGVPTLDGLGPIAGGAHGPDEYVELDSIVPRVTLLAGLLLAIGRDPQVAARRAERRRP